MLGQGGEAVRSTGPPCTSSERRGEMSKMALHLGAVRNIILVSIVGAALLGASQIPAIAAPVHPHSRAAVPSPVPGGARGEFEQRNYSATVRMPNPCKPIAVGDFVHVSSTPPATASGHGWWNRGSCTVPRATVVIDLQEHFSDGSWRDKGTQGSGTFRPGGGAGHRATGRATCTGGTALTGWRSVVNVETVGQFGVDSVTTSARNIDCRK